MRSSTSPQLVSFLLTKSKADPDPTTNLNQIQSSWALLSSPFMLPIGPHPLLVKLETTRPFRTNPLPHLVFSPPLSGSCVILFTSSSFTSCDTNISSSSTLKTLLLIEDFFLSQSPGCLFCLKKDGQWISVNFNITLVIDITFLFNVRLASSEKDTLGFGVRLGSKSTLLHAKRTPVNCKFSSSAILHRLISPSQYHIRPTS